MLGAGELGTLRSSVSWRVRAFDGFGAGCIGQMIYLVKALSSET